MKWFGWLVGTGSPSYFKKFLNFKWSGCNKKWRQHGHPSKWLKFIAALILHLTDADLSTSKLANLTPVTPKRLHKERIFPLIMSFIWWSFSQDWSLLKTEKSWLFPPSLYLIRLFSKAFDFWPLWSENMAGYTFIVVYYSSGETLSCNLFLLRIKTYLLMPVKCSCCEKKPFRLCKLI